MSNPGNICWVTTAAWVQAISSIIGAGVAIAALVVAIKAAEYARGQFRAAADAVAQAAQARKDSERQHQEQIEESRQTALEVSRPYVIVTVEPSKASQHLFDLVVRNIGQRPALEVSVSLNPPPKRVNEIPGRELSRTKLLNQPVKMIAPGQEMRVFYDSHIERHGREDVPTSHQVSLRYQDSSGRRYTEDSIADLEAMKGAAWIGMKTVHDIGDSIAEIRKILENASILARRGSVEVDAAVEPLSERRDRQEQEEADARKAHDRLAAMLLPSTAPAAGTPGSRAETSEKTNQ